MTRDQLRRIAPHASEDTLAETLRNWERDNGASPVARPVCSKQPERDQRGEGESGSVEAGTASMGYRVEFTSFRRKSLDSHDNLASSFKNLTDRVTAWLGFKEDCDPRLKWEFHQVVTKGRQGVLVKVERFMLPASRPRSMTG